MRRLVLNVVQEASAWPNINVCVCVCVVISFILDVRFVDVPSGVRYFQHAHFTPIVGVGKRGEY